MKKVISLIIVIIICFSLTSCVYSSYSTKDKKEFAKIYETYADSYDEELALGFGEYHYGSYFCAFPREAPDEMTEYYFYHDSLFAWDEYVIYFVYHLERDAFSDFSDKLKEFKIEYNGISNSPVYDTTHFSLPTYIFTLSETKSNGEYNRAEYVMLDEENLNVINVYTNYARESSIKENCKYDILPNSRLWKDLMPSNKTTVDGYFSVYNFSNATENGNDAYVIPKLSEIENQFLFAN